MNLFQLATRGVDLGNLPDEEAPRQSVAFEPSTNGGKFSVPTDLNDAFEFAAKDFGIDPDVLRAVAYAESRFNPDVVSGKVKSKTGATGLMQFMPATAKEYGIDPLDPVQSIFGAAAYLRKSLDKFDGDYGKAVASYNAGPNRKDFDASDWDARMPAETQGYLRTVFTAADQLKQGGAATAKPTQAATNVPDTGDETARLAARYKAPREAVPNMTAGSVAQDALASVLAVGPTALKGVGELASMATGGRVGQEFAKDMQGRIDTVTGMVGSERGAAQKRNFQRDMADDSVSISDALLNNKGAMLDMALPSMGSMLLPVGAAGAATKLATLGKVAQGLDKAALAARVASAQQAAGIGATVAQNAASTFAELVDKGANLGDAYIAAGITVPFSLIAGKLTGGGAEGALIKGMGGKVGAAEAIKRGAVEVPKAMIREGGQEVGEEAGQITGEAVGTGKAPTLQGAAKQLAVAGTMGGLVGGGMNLAQQALERSAPTVESQPTTPTAPQVTPSNGVYPNSTATQAVDNIAAAILEAEGATAKTTPVPPAGEAKNAGTEAVQPGQPGATQATADAVAVDGAGQPEQAQALTQPSNFSATPTATIGTQTNVQAGPGFTGQGLAAEMAALKARSQTQATQQAAPAAPQPVTGGLAAEMSAIKSRNKATTTVDPAKPAPVGIGRNNTPLAEGGKPFKSKAEADTARKLQPMMRVKKEGKGFVLVEKTAAQIAAQEKAARRNLGSVGAGGGPLSAHAFLASQGGLSKSAMADLGFDNNVRVGSKWLFTNTGMTLEGMTEALQQNGYVQSTEQNPAIELVKRSANGQPQYTAEGWDQIAQAEATARFEDHLAAQQDAMAEDEDFDPFSPDAIAGEFEGDDLVVAGYDDASPSDKAEFAALLAAAEADGIDTEAILEQAAQQTQDGTNEDYQNRALALIAAARSQRVAVDRGANTEQGRQDAQRESTGNDRAGDGREGAPGADGEGLTTYTPAEVTARQDAAAEVEATAKRAEEAAARAEAAAKQASEIAQRSVAAADTFELGGNAEDNLSGQKGLKFSKSTDKPSTPASTIRAAITKAYGNLLDKLEGKGLVTIAQTEREAIEAAAQARADKTGGDVEQIKRSMLASVQMQRVWHGTPHRGIQQFSTEKIGTGEGAQAYGWGLYFANQKDVADFYRRNLSGLLKTGNQQLDDILVSNGGDLQKSISELRQMEESSPPSRRGIWTDALYVAIELDRSGALIRNGGQLYEVEIPEDGDMLLWDKPLSEQPENVLAALRRGYDEQGGDYPDKSATPKTGREIYNDFRALAGGFESMDQRAASEYLASLGIKGIKYLDGTSRSAGDGSYNYVIFDGSDTQIVDVKYSANGNIEGFFDSQTGKSFLVADNLNAASAPGTLMHEVGIHMAADGKLEPLFTRAGNLLKLARNNPFIQRVQARMDQAGETSNEEAAAYIVTEYENDRAAAPDSVVKWVKDFIADVRAWLFGKGVLLKADQLTVADIAAVARANANRMAQGDGNGDVRYSRGTTTGMLDNKAPSPQGDAQQGAVQGNAVIDAGIQFVSAIETLAEKHGRVYIRWSPSAKGDLSSNQQSRDFVSGATHSGLSAVEITGDMHPVDIASRLSEYGFLRMQDKRSAPRVYLADRVGTDSDGYASIKPTELLIDSTPDVVKAIDSKLSDIMDAMDDVQRESEKLAMYPGHKAVTERLESAKAKLNKLLPNEQSTPTSQGVDIRRSVAGGGQSVTQDREEVTRSLWKDETGRMQFAPGAWLFDKMGKVASPVLSWAGMKAASPELKKQLREMKLGVQKAQETSAMIATETAKLSQDEREMVSDLIEKTLKAGVVPPAHAVKLAALINDTMSKQTDELIELGMLAKETAERWRGEYLPRFYADKLRKNTDPWADALKNITKRARMMMGVKGKHLKARGLFETVAADQVSDYEALGWEVRDPGFDPATDKTAQMWRDFTPEERADMGEIRDAGFRFVMGYMQTQKDIALGRMFKRMSEADTMSSRLQTGEFTVQVPDTKVDGTGAKVYGALAGRYVSKDTLDHLSGFGEVHNDMLATYRKAMSLWKEGKTVLNPVSHVNNTVSNVTMAHLAGVGYHRVDKYAAAVRDFATGSKMIQEAKDAGLFLGGFNEAELFDAMPDELKALAKIQEGTGSKVVNGMMQALSFGLRKPMAKAYEFEDSFFKYLIYRDARNRGMAAGDAADYAQKYIFTYDDLPKTARKIRDFGMPFFAYTYKAVPALLESAMTHPVRMALPAAMIWAGTTLAYALAEAGDDEPWDELAKRYASDGEFRDAVNKRKDYDQEHLPKWMQGYTSLAVPKAIRVGMDKTLDMPVFLDISRLIPGGDLFDVTPNAGGLPLPQPLTPNHPILTLFTGLIGNKDTFKGNDLVDKNDTNAEAAAKRAEWVYRQVAPAIAFGNYHWDRGMEMLANAAGGEIKWLPDALSERYTGVGKDGLPITPEYGIPQTFGIKIRPMDQDKAESIDRAMDNKLLREIDAEIRQIKRLNSVGAMSDKLADKKIDYQLEKKDRIRDGLTVDGDAKR